MAFTGKKSTKAVARPCQYPGRFATLAALTGNYTLSLLDGQVIRIDPGGASRDVTLEQDWEQDGMWVEIINIADAAEDIVLKDPAGSTIVTISQNEKAKASYDGQSWTHSGIVTIALS